MTDYSIHDIETGAGGFGQITDLTGSIKFPISTGGSTPKTTTPTRIKDYVGACLGYLNLSQGGFSGALDLSGMTGLKYIDLNTNNFTSADFSGDTSLKSIVASIPGDIASINLTGCTALTTLVLITNSLTALDVSDCPLVGLYLMFNTAITSLDLSGKTNLDTVQLANLPALTDLDFTGCTSMTNYTNGGGVTPTNITFTGCTALTDIDVSSDANITALNLTTNSALTSIIANETGLTTLDISGNPLLTVVSLSVCAIADPADIDAILVALDGFGLSNGTVNLNGGTNAIPTSTGLTAKASLEGKGWTVTVSAPAFGGIATQHLVAGGSGWFPGDTYHVDAGDGNAVGVVDTISPATTGPFNIAAVHQGGGSIIITAVDQGTKTFTVSGDWTEEFFAGGAGVVIGSTGNNAVYSVTAASFSSGHTDVTVSQSIPSAVADGVFIDFGVVIVSGDHVSAIVGASIHITGSTGNDGFWQKSPPALVGGDTKVIVQGPYPDTGPLLSAVADGAFNTGGGAINTTHITTPGTGYSIADDTITAISPSPGQAAALSVDSVV